MDSNTPFVYVVGGDPLVCKMFLNRGWRVADEQTDMTKHEDMKLDLVCFTGGEDVSPEIYGETNQGSRGCNLSRDQEEVEVFNHYKGLGVPMVGICRGGQLLNVLNGGKMIQDLGGTISGDVECFINWGLEEDIEWLKLRVDHHQGMVRSDCVSVHGSTHNARLGYRVDYSLFYPETKSYCFQPHPEWGHKETEDLFFDLIKEYIL